MERSYRDHNRGHAAIQRLWHDAHNPHHSDHTDHIHVHPAILQDRDADFVIILDGFRVILLLFEPFPGGRRRLRQA
jgi:hypothetical protein